MLILVHFRLISSLVRSRFSLRPQQHSIMTELELIVIGSEKRGHFAPNANFYHFSNCHHAKAFRVLGFPLALQTL